MSRGTLTNAEVLQALRERTLIRDRIARLSRFIDDLGPTTPRCAEIMRECRGLLEEELQTIEQGIELERQARRHGRAT